MHRNRTAYRSLGVALLAGLAGAAGAGDLYVAGNAGQIWHFDTATGTLDSPVSCGATVEGLALQGRDVLAASTDSTIYRIDLDTGAFKDFYPVVGQPLSLARWGNTLYVTTTNGDMQWLNADDGSTIDTYYVHDPLEATMLFGNRIFTGSHSTAVYASPVGEMDFQFFTACGGSVNSITTNGVDVVIGALQGTVYIYDATNGSYKGTWHVQSDCVGVAFVDDRLFIAGSDGEIHKMNLDNGAIEQTYDTGLALTAMIAAEACAADFNGDGQINTLDFLAFLNAWNDRDGSADFDGNGTINTQDVLVFLNAYTAGCE
jgi:hypothetical protein